MELAPKGWIAKSRGGGKMSPAKKKAGMKKTINPKKGKMLLGSKMKNKTKNPGAL